MQALDSTIAYYLCSIMVVLALIIAVGAVRQHAKGKQSQDRPPSE
jgi:hypothetical protein